MTDAQVAAMESIIEDFHGVIDRVYYDRKHNSINFRSRHTISGRFTAEQNRLAIMPNGTVVDRNTHKDFVGVRA